MSKAGLLLSLLIFFVFDASVIYAQDTQAAQNNEPTPSTDTSIEEILDDEPDDHIEETILPIMKEGADEVKAQVKKHELETEAESKLKEKKEKTAKEDQQDNIHDSNEPQIIKAEESAQVDQPTEDQAATSSIVHNITDNEAVNEAIAADTGEPVSSPDSLDVVGEGTQLELKLSETPTLKLNRYNIFEDLPKLHQPLKLMKPPLSRFTYGPYESTSDIYMQPYPILEEIAQRILTLETTISALETEIAAKQKDKKKAKEGEVDQDEIAKKNLITEMQILLADLYSMRYEKKNKEQYIRTATNYYKKAYANLSDNFLDHVSLNMTHALLREGDFATAFPIIKRLTKNGNPKLMREINDTLIEFYVMSSRYHKADDVLGLMTKHKELVNESDVFLQRSGDIMFFLKRFEDAANWYQAVLKPKEKASAAENLSWIYLAESLHQVDNNEISKKIYGAMLPFFTDTVYEGVIKFRLAGSIAAKQDIMKISSDTKVVGWMRNEILTEEFKQNPKLFTAESFNIILEDLDLNNELRDQIIFLQGFAYRNENKFYRAINNFYRLEVNCRNLFVRNALNDIIIETLVKKGLLNKTPKEGFRFLRYLLALKYNLKTYSPDKIYEMLYHNLKLVGLEQASAELTLRIIEQSVHQRRDQAYIQFKLAENTHDAFAYRQSIKILRQIDTKLLEPSVRDQYFKLLVENQIRTKQNIEAMDTLGEWEKTGTTAANTYWIASKKAQILYGFGKFKQGLEIVNATIGDANTQTALPEMYVELAKPLMTYQVLFYSKLNKSNECLVAFFSHQDLVIESDLKDEVIFGVISAAMSMNKTHEVEKLLDLAHAHLSDANYQWLKKWTDGEMWINQVNKYLDKSNMAINAGENP